MSTTTQLSTLNINILTTEQYNDIADKDENELYLLTDAGGFDSSLDSTSENAVQNKVVTSALNEKAPLVHTHEVYENQNAFSNISIGSTVISADSSTDTLTFVAGSNITLTPDSTNDKITIDASGDNISFNQSLTSGTKIGTLVINDVNYDLYAPTNASTADKLSTVRTISVSNAVTSTATNFDGSANISIPINSVKGAYLSWGGKNFSAGYGPIDAAMIGELGADRFAFGNPSGITIEYSRDAGETWTDYEASDVAKKSLLSTGTTLYIGKADDTNKATGDYQLRITFNSVDLGLYTSLNKFAINVSTEGSQGSWCTIDGALASDPTTFNIFANKISMSGWPGWNIINTPSFTLHSGSQSQLNQYVLLRFTFGCTSGSTTYKGLNIRRIKAFGGVGWVTPSNMSKTGHIYTYDYGQNAVFPAQLRAKEFKGPLIGNADTSTKLFTARTISLSGDTIGSTTFDGSSNVTISTTLADSGVSAGGYGPSANVSPEHNGTFSVPYFTVDAKGRITSASTKTITLPTDNDTHYTSKNVVGNSTATSNTTTALTNGNVYLNSIENGSVTSAHKISGSGATTVTTDTSGNIIISSTDNNTTYSTGTATTSGLTKLYTGTGSNTDGTMTQSAITTQLNGKQSTITGGASTITTSNLTASRALVSNTSGKVAVSTITSTELGYLSGVTSGIQTQLDGKQAALGSAGDSDTPIYFSDGNPVACTGYMVKSDSNGYYIEI